MGQRGATYSSGRLVRHFLDSGEQGIRSGVYKDLEAELRCELVAQANLSRSEVPLLSYFGGPERWTVLTTQQLKARVERGLEVAPLEEIVGATFPDGWLQVGRKNEVDRAAISLADGKSFLVYWEPGRPLSGFLNVLKLVAR